MKQTRLVASVAAAAVIMSAALVMSACQNANTPNSGSEDSVTVKPTGPADPALKGTVWESPQSVIFFGENGNRAHIAEIDALYTVAGTNISFDCSKGIAIDKNMTVEKHIAFGIAAFKKDIAEIKGQLQKVSDPQKKQRLEEELKRAEDALRYYENPTAEGKKQIAEQIEYARKRAVAMEGYARFSGTVNAEKTKLTIPKCPVYDGEAGAVMVQAVTFEKRR